MAVSSQRTVIPARGARDATPSAAIDLDEYIRRVTALADSCRPDRLSAHVARELKRLLAAAGWLPAACCEPGHNSYRRHLLHADPAGRFTVLSVVWRPGQGTPVHGHTAWGVVGVYRGMPSVANYRLRGERGLDLVCEAAYEPGDISCVRPGVEYPHRVHNASPDIAITLHTYGRDLRDDPGAINILL